MVKILDTLTKAGLIERRVNPKDRRQHYISLSNKGQKQTKEITKSFAIIDKQMFSNVSDKDKASFNSTLDIITKNLEEVPKNNLFFNYKKTK